jgi:teichuronic acid biosynthesis glycosyltransferase TuaG
VQAKLVSVVIPTYNHAIFIKDALQTLVAQTYTNWQAIIINNYSTDKTEEVIASFNDPRIQMINFANQGIIAASRNRGIELASGEYVAFLDSDDLWTSTKLERCVNMLETKRLDWVCHGENWFGEGIDKPRDVFYGPENKASFDALLYNGNCISTSAVVVKRDFLAQVNGFSEAEAYVTAEDYHLWLRLAQNKVRLGFIKEILGAYRIHANGQSRAAVRNMQATGAVVESFFSQQGTPSMYERWKRRKRRGSIVYSGARALQNIHNHNEAWAFFLKALWTYPFDRRLVPAMVMNALKLRF